ncbi:MAG: tRNA (guanosine(37)-N1)-methyltransferase TrmD [Bacilli bacterium]|nr:tRNA (guanosine(37)-N1)-methyltransferase TrmD [Bacilli bacterium]
MKIDILSIFPEMFDGFLNTSIIKRAIDSGYVDIKIHNFRDYSLDKHKKVDDYPYGGGAGMILMCEPIFRCLDKIKTEDSLVIMMSPSGKVFKQDIARDLSKKKHLIFLCGHYEGFDERILSIVDMQLSIGDYVLTGGEVPAMVITDAITRLIPGVISSESLLSESFNDGLLDYPNYTRPEEFRGMRVPDVLLSGHHENIRKYREEERIKRTKEVRCDLDGGDLHE